MLHLEERRIECTCEACWALRSGDREYRPVGTRVAWLPDLAMNDERWAGFGIPIGLAFFMRSTHRRRRGGALPEPGGRHRVRAGPAAWDALVADNPVLARLESDAEGLIVNRLADPPQYAIAPIDECYRLVGLVKANWEGISGGAALEGAIGGFFDELRRRAASMSERRRPPPPALEFGVLDAERRAQLGRAAAALRRPRDRASRARGLHDRAVGRRS